VLVSADQSCGSCFLVQSSSGNLCVCGRSALSTPITQTIPIECDMAPKWLPDWWKPSQYPDPSKAEVTRLDWAWQFLRRNPEYQQLWSNLIAPNYKPAHVTWSMKQTAGSVRRVRDRVRAHLKAPPSANYQLAQFETLFGIITIPPDPSKRKARLGLQCTYQSSRPRSAGLV
jgi:Proteobacterial transcriptional regulator-like domain